MRNFNLGLLIATVIVLGITNFLSFRKNHQTELQSTGLILDQISNVGKLVVTEGHFSEVVTYKDAKKMYLNITANKKAIVVVNAEATIQYDLRKIEHVVDPESKTLTITHIPKAEIKINPDIRYHDLEEDFFNPFTPEDHNLIKQQVLKKLEIKIAASNLAANAENRLLSELQKIYILTNSLGWKLIYNGETVDTLELLRP